MPVSNAVLFRQLENWGFRSGKTKYGRILMRGPTGGHVLAPPPEANGLADTSVVHNASRLLGVSVDRFWLGPLDELPAFDDHTEPEMESSVHPTASTGVTDTGRPSSSKRFASSYQAEILRYLDSLPGAALEDQRMGVVRAIWSALGKSAGQHLSSCGSSLSALENDGRVVSTYGHRSLDGKLCRVSVSVLAEPPVGATTPPVYPVELSLSPGTHTGREQVEYGPRQLSEREAELRAHIDHLSEETMLWEDMATELEASLVEARQRQADENALAAVLDELSRDLERKDAMIRWRDRQVRHRDVTISTLSREFREARAAYEAAKSEYEALKSSHNSSVREREKLSNRITHLTDENRDLHNELADLKQDLFDTEADLERVQRRMFFSVVETLATGLVGEEDVDLATRILFTLLMPQDPFMDRGATRHRFQSVIAGSSHQGVKGFQWDCPDLPRQSVYEQPVIKHELKKELSKTVGNWYGRLLQFCTMIEDMLGPGVTVVEKDEYGFCRVTLPAQIYAAERGEVLVVGDRQLNLRGRIKLREAGDTFCIAPFEDETKPTTEILIAPTDAAIRSMTGLHGSEMRRLPSNDLWVSLGTDKDNRPALVRIPNSVLQGSVDSRRINDLLSHGNRLFGLREITSTFDQSRKLAIVTTLLGMGGLTHMSSSKDDPREIVFNHGELAGLRGRFLYFHNTTDQNIKIQLHPMAHHDWHSRLSVCNSDGTEEAEILIAVENDL